MIRQYLRDIINNHKTQNEWKIQLVMEINFISSKDFKDTDTMYKKSYSIDIMIGYKIDQIIEELFESFRFKLWWIIHRFPKMAEE